MSDAIVETGVKESKEAIEGLKVIAKFAGKVLTDNKVSTADFSHLVSLALEFDKISEGVKDIDLALAELKNLDEGELIEIISGFYGVFSAFKEGKLG